MAANMKAVKLRIKSVESTMQITKAMELVASSKLRKAKERADTCRPYFQELYRTLQEIAKENTEFYSVYAKEAIQEKCCYVLIAGDRGLAGGYNANLLRCFEEDAKGKMVSVLPIGKKAVEYVRSNNLEYVTDAFAEIADISVADCFEIASILCKEFRQGTFGHVCSKAQPAPAGAGNAPMGGMEPPLQRNDTAASGWDTLSGQNTAYNSQPEVVIPMPADFDAEEFLRGAKMAYNRLQAAWDSRDLNDIAQFASPAVMDAVRQQLAEETEPSKTEILLVNAQLLSVVNEDKEQRAQVYFDVLMRERPDQPTPSNVREIWHFVRELDGGTWKLDGIQQVA